MGQQQVKDIAGSFISELHSLEQGEAAGMNSLTAMFAADADLINPLTEHGASRHGRDEIAAFWREYAATFGSVRSDFFDVTTSDHSAELFWRAQGTSQSGQPIRYEGVSLLVLDDPGKIVRFQGFFDTSKLTLKAKGH